MKKRMTLAELNELGRPDFVRVIGPVFEHSPWIAEETWLKKPFASLAELHQELCRTVRESGQEKQLGLIRAHPDLVGQAARAGKLTTASTSEQASAGLNRLSPCEIAAFEQYNEAYRSRFDFPFVICARLNKKEAILRAFPVRLQQTREAEMATALEEIYKIAWLRLQDCLEI